MKPKDLKPPFTWDERHVLIQDRVWYVPDYLSDYSTFTFPGWAHPDLFGNDKPVCIEYCCGNGTWIAAKAVEHPEYNWVAVEKQFERVRKVWSKIHNDSLDNLIVVCGEACLTTQHYVPDASVHAVYVNFPDPWPKERHAKHRLIRAPFVEQIHRVLQPDGVATVVTDDTTYSEMVIREMAPFPGLRSLYTAPYFSTELEGYGTSFFDTLWREKGRLIRYHQYQKIKR